MHTCTCTLNATDNHTFSAERQVPKQKHKTKLFQRQGGEQSWRVEFMSTFGGLVLAEFQSVSDMPTPQLVR